MLAFLATITLEVPIWINPNRAFDNNPPPITAVNEGERDVCNITYESRYDGLFLNSSFETKRSEVRVPANGSAVISREFSNRVRLVSFNYCND